MTPLVSVKDPYEKSGQVLSLRDLIHEFFQQKFNYPWSGNSFKRLKPQVSHTNIAKKPLKQRPEMNFLKWNISLELYHKAPIQLVISMLLKCFPFYQTRYELHGIKLQNCSSNRTPFEYRYLPGRNECIDRIPHIECRCHICLRNISACA